MEKFSGSIDGKDFITGGLQSRTAETLAAQAFSGGGGGENSFDHRLFRQI